MRMKGKLIPPFIALSITLLWPLMAQAEERGGTLKLEEVVVTATKTGEAVREAPATVEVVTSDEIAVTNSKSVDEAIRWIPGLYLKRSKGLSETMPTVSMRGFYGPERNLILIDSIPAPRGWSWSRLPLGVVERIEVAKGPFSALYGERAMGGVVNLITRSPEKPLVRLTASAGENGLRIYELSAAGGGDKINCILSAVKRKTDGYATIPVTLKEYKGKGEPKAEVIGFSETKDRKGNTVYLIGDKGRNWYEDESYILKLSCKPFADSHLTFITWHCEENYGYKGGRSYLQDASDFLLLKSGLFKLHGTNKRIKVSETKFLSSYGGEPVDMVGLSFKRKLDGVGELNSIIEWDRVKHWWVSPSGTYSLSPKRSVRGELRATLNIIPKSKLTLGAELRWSEVSAEKWDLENWLDTTSKRRLIHEVRGKVRTAGAYLQEELKLRENLNLYLGARLDVWENRDGYNREWRSKRYAEESFDRRRNFSFNPKLALVFRPDGRTTLRTSLGSAFRGPEVEDLYRSWYYWGRLYLCNPELGPEKTYSGEIGLDRRIGDRLLLRTAAFYNRMRDLIYSRSLSDVEVEEFNKRHKTSYKAIKRKENIAEAESRGFEVGIVARPAEWISPFANLTYTGTKVLDNPANPDSIGKRLPRIPLITYNLGLNIRYGHLAGWVLGRYVDKVYNEDDNSDTQNGVYGSYDPFFVLDLSLSYDVDPYTGISVSVENLLDREYYQYYKSPGRTFMVRLSRVIR